MNGRPHPALRKTLLHLVVAASALLPLRLEAAAPWAEPLPWDVQGSGPGFTFGFQRFDDPASDWQADAFTLMSVVSQGASNRVYLRWRHLDFQRASLPVFTRWPEIAATPDEGEAVDPDWPGEAGIAGWGRPEIGLLAPIDLPLLGRGVFCGEAALPFARNDLYPFASRSLTLRAALRRSVDLNPDLSLTLQVEQVLNMEAAGEDFSGEAFPARTAWGGGLGWRFTEDGALSLEARTAGAQARRLGLTLRWPLGEDRGLVLGVMRSLADQEDRLFETRVTAAVTIGIPAAPEVEPSAEQPPTGPGKKP